MVEFASRPQCWLCRISVSPEIEQGVLGVWLTDLAQGLKFICL